MNKPPVPSTDRMQKQNPPKDHHLKDDGVQKDGYDLPIEGAKTDSCEPQKIGTQDVKNALEGG